MKISLLLPTKNRVERLKSFLNSILETANHIQDIEVILYIDQGDSVSEQFTFGSEKLKVIKIIGPHTSMGHANSTCLAKASGDLIMLVNDDILIRTPGWDDIVISQAKRYSDEIFLLFPNDLFKTNKLSAFPIISKKLCSLIQAPFPDCFQGSFIDSHLFDIFNRLKRKGIDRIAFLSDVVFEHMHYRLKKSEVDKTYLERNRFGDDATFLSLHTYRNQLAHYLFDYIRFNQKISIPLPILPDVKIRSTPSIRLLLKSTLFDSSISLYQRIRLFNYHLARQVYQALSIRRTF